MALGALSIFVYVGCEVTIGSFMTNYLMQPRTLGMAAQDAGRLVSFYWGGAMVGRFIGSFVLQRISPSYVLVACAVVAAILATTSSMTVGPVAAYSLIAVGLFNSIMFPTIFSLALDGLGPDTEQGSGILCMAIVGGAVVPFIHGSLADHVGLHMAFIAPALCYVYIVYYGLKGSQHGQRAQTAPAA